MKSTRWARSSVIVMPEAIMSNSPLAMAAKMPSQAVVWNSATQLIFSQMALTTSTSKPTISPASLTVSNGG